MPVRSRQRAAKRENQGYVRPSPWRRIYSERALSIALRGHFSPKVTELRSIKAATGIQNVQKGADFCGFSAH
jgi:hypothetical protein